MLLKNNHLDDDGDDNSDDENHDNYNVHWDAFSSDVGKLRY